jgi:hypothetical protein
MKRTPSYTHRFPIPVTAALALLLSFATADGATFEPAATCKACHKVVHEQWSGSLHASAFTHPDFQVPYNQVREKNPSEAATCEKCHAPLKTLFPRGSAKGDAFAAEGVTCDFCHSVQSVDLSGPYPRAYKVTPGIKFGPKGDYREKTVHVTRPSSLIKSSAFCAGCHEFRNRHDVPVLSTVSEWEESFYKGEGVHCQYCHLPELFDARFVEGDKGKRKGPADHSMMGGHSQERLARAIPIQATLTTLSDGAEVTVRLRNETVGHMTPSGWPSHRIRLVSTLYDEDGKVLGTQEERFERVLGDGNGKALSTPEEFLDAREVIRDNRIKPKEERVVRHRFPAATGARLPAAAEVNLVYELPTREIGAALRTFEIPISKTTVTIRQGKHWKAIAIAAAGSLAAVLLAALYAILRRGKKGDATP